MLLATRPVTIKAAGTQDGTEDGVFEAIVAAYNIDSTGDKIVPGAFIDTLKSWTDSGDPIPVLWSHMANDPESHIGVVEAAEERLGEGLWVRARLDVDEPKALKVYKLLKGRRVTQFSFAYDVEDGQYVETSGGESYFELRRLKLYEVGPTLIGANQATSLLDVKHAGLLPSDQQLLHDLAVKAGATCAPDPPSPTTPPAPPPAPAPGPDQAPNTEPAPRSPASLALLAALADFETI